jgi:hypothetical protein
MTFSISGVRTFGAKMGLLGEAKLLGKYLIAELQLYNILKGFC